MSTTAILLIIVGALVLLQVVVALAIVLDARRFRWDEMPPGTGWGLFAMTHGFHTVISTYREYRREAAVLHGYERCPACTEPVRGHATACPHCGSSL